MLIPIGSLTLLILLLLTLLRKELRKELRGLIRGELRGELSRLILGELSRLILGVIIGVCEARLKASLEKSPKLNPPLFESRALLLFTVHVYRIVLVVNLPFSEPLVRLSLQQPLLLALLDQCDVTRQTSAMTHDSLAAQLNQSPGVRGHQSPGGRGHQSPGVRDHWSPGVRDHQSPGIRSQQMNRG